MLKLQNKGKGDDKVIKWYSIGKLFVYGHYYIKIEVRDDTMDVL